MTDRLSFGFHNPNHAAALACALLPLCFGWRRAAWVGRGLAALLFAVLLLTQSRTGLIVAALEWTAWLAMAKGKGGSRPLERLGKWTVAALAVGLSFWWLGPRLSLDCSILNRPKIWLAGLRLFAMNPNGVGLGNSGTLASVFLLPDTIPDVRTLISSHLTLLAECGWLVGWAHFAFLAFALHGFRRSPRVGLAFAGLALSACASTVFDWPVLFDFATKGNLGWANWILSWLTLSLFVSFGIHLIVMSAAKTVMPAALGAAGITGALVFAAWCVPPRAAPCIQDGYAASGDAPRTLALYDDRWTLRAVRPRVGANALLPIRPVGRFPRDFDFSSVSRVHLFGDCREWAYLVPKGIPVTCADD